MSETSCDTGGVTQDLETLWRQFVNCRAHFPSLTEGVLGRTRVETAPFYAAEGFRVSFVFPYPLTTDDVARLHGISHWINQNFIIRLYAVLNCHGLVSEHDAIDQSIDGWECVDLVRRLRNYFAHGSGNYDHNKPEHRKTIQVMKEFLRLECDVKNAEFPLAIDTVLQPLHGRCLEYAERKAKSA